MGAYIMPNSSAISKAAVSRLLPCLPDAWGGTTVLCLSGITTTGSAPLSVGHLPNKVMGLLRAIVLQLHDDWIVLASSSTQGPKAAACAATMSIMTASSTATRQGRGSRPAKAMLRPFTTTQTFVFSPANFASYFIQ
jgi:hypothetical protein